MTVPRGPLWPRTPTVLLVRVAMLLSLLLLSLGSPAAALVPPTDNPSLMIVGDSISQGRDGDFTWRYRLWEWLDGNGVAVRFVGPYTGTVQQASGDPASPPPPYPPTPTSANEVPAVSQLGGYSPDIPADSGFLQGGGNRHFAAWGRQVAQDAHLIRDMVAQYQPDYLLVELGFNDVGWFVSDADGTQQSMRAFVRQARAAKPDLAFAVANIPQRSFIGGRDDLITKTEDYNAALPAFLDSLSTDQSPIRLVQFRENYDCNPDACPVGSDGLHPNALGEYQIAKAFADTLSQGYGFPGSAFRVPASVPARPCDAPSNVVARPSACGVAVTWDPVPGAYGYIVRSWFDGGPLTVLNTTAPAYATTWTAANITWHYQIQAFCANTVSAASGEATATAHPTCAPGPPNLRVSSTADGLDFAWDPVPGYDVLEYGAIYWDQSRAAFLNTYGWTGTSASYHGLQPGDRVLTAVETWARVGSDLCAGLPAGGQGVVVGGVMPQAPSGLQVATIREGATVQLTFDADPNAFAYGFFTRSLLEGDDALYVPGGYTSDVPCIGVTFLVPGAWNYEFCVVAYNGNYTSPMSECVRGPKEITSVPDCPAAVGPVGGPDPNPTVTWTQPSPTPIGGGGDGNGDGGGDIVYIDPLIWGQPDPTVFCQPPCTLVLPPWPVDGGLTTISFPPATETIEETWPETSDGLLVYASSTTTVTITLEAVTASVVNVSNIVIPTTATTTTGGVVVLLTVTSSVDPPPTTITESSHHVTWTYSAGPYPTGTAAVGPPPGRNPGTIHFSVGPPSPTCKGKCGRLGHDHTGGGGGGGGGLPCIGPGCGPGRGGCVGLGCLIEGGGDGDGDGDDGDDDDDDKTTSSPTGTCATETNTECHQECTTRPCATVCHTYLGCDCTTSTVTDYWVSCGSASCRTTSSELITGCFLTATRTTTGAYCPATLTADPQGDDQGDDAADLPDLGVTVTATYGEHVQAGPSAYYLAGGYVNIGGTAYPVPSVASPVVTTLGAGQPRVTLFPSHVDASLSITLTWISVVYVAEPPATTTFGRTTTKPTTKPKPPPTTKPTTTSSTAYPTNTAINVGGAYCFDGDPGYVSFTLSDAQAVIQSFCDADYVLDPSDAVGHAEGLERGAYTVYVSARWAPDQSGCGAKEAFPFAGDDLDAQMCLNAWSTDFFCLDETAQGQDSSYGGAYVLQPPNTGGCILLSLFAQ